MFMLIDSSLLSIPVCAIRHAFNVKPQSRLFPGHAHVLDPMLTAGYPWHLCFKHRRKATGIQMPPALSPVTFFDDMRALHHRAM